MGVWFSRPRPYPTGSCNPDTLLYYLRDHRETATFNKDLAYKPHGVGYKRRGGGANPKGVALDDVWDEVALYSPWIKSFSKEKLGYMTQKPLALLERIIGVSSNVGDLVLDPFCGCGTTIEAAEKLGRKWVGIDVAIRAVEIIKDRLDHRFDRRVWTEHGEPADIDQAAHLAETNAYDFQWWAVRQLGGQPPKGEKKKGGDGGVDGELTLVDLEQGASSRYHLSQGWEVTDAGLREEALSPRRCGKRRRTSAHS